jgi:DNA-binding transcriptional MerR regulator
LYNTVHTFFTKGYNIVEGYRYYTPEHDQWHFFTKNLVTGISKNLVTVISKNLVTGISKHCTNCKKIGKDPI